MLCSKSPVGCSSDVGGKIKRFHRIEDISTLRDKKISSKDGCWWWFMTAGLKRRSFFTNVSRG